MINEIILCVVSIGAYLLFEYLIYKHIRQALKGKGLIQIFMERYKRRKKVRS